MKIYKPDIRDRQTGRLALLVLGLCAILAYLAIMIPIVVVVLFCLLLIGIVALIFYFAFWPIEKKS